MASTSGSIAWIVAASRPAVRCTSFTWPSRVNSRTNAARRPSRVNQSFMRSALMLQTRSTRVSSALWRSSIGPPSAMSSVAAPHLAHDVADPLENAQARGDALGGVLALLAGELLEPAFEGVRLGDGGVEESRHRRRGSREALPQGSDLGEGRAGVDRLADVVEATEDAAQLAEGLPRMQ